MKSRLYIWLTLLACIAFNWPFVLHGSLGELRKTPDVNGIIAGYHAAPDIWRDGASWWHGSWMYAGFPRFRPLSSYLYWFDCWAGFNISWVVPGLINFALFAICCALTAAITRRFTGSASAAAVAGVMAAGIQFVNSHDAGWLSWFPNADNLLSAAFVLGALLAFDRWITGERRHIAAAWLLFACGCLSKEFAWTFPVMAFMVAMLRPTSRARRACALQPCLMAVAVVAFALYRSHVIPASETPNAGSFGLASLFVVTHPAVRAVMLGEYWLLFACFGAALLTVRKVRVSMLSFAPAHLWALGAAVTLTALLVASPAAIVVAYQIAEAPLGYAKDAAEILAIPAILFLLHRHRRAIGPTWIAAFVLPVLGYAPTIQNMTAHWHYTVVPWFFLCIAYGVVARMAELQWSGMQHQAVKSRHAAGHQALTPAPRVAMH